MPLLGQAYPAYVFVSVDEKYGPEPESHFIPEAFAAATVVPLATTVLFWLDPRNLIVQEPLEAQLALDPLPEITYPALQSHCPVIPVPPPVTLNVPLELQV